MKPTGSQPSNIPSQSQPSTTSLRHLYLSQFPDFLHSYIDDIVDVGDDGNFCFGVIAALLGCVVESWNGLKVEHLGVQGQEKCMVIPDMGILFPSYLSSTYVYEEA
ncbi:hypothetical protein KIW84_056568 [Lathyrus oleraceus]|uniref:Uncharacterized protein n=1 Tax=Pisum sativum TaxID=3888 RepID=A0A9D4X1B8_PEA|nr:hypothetical protein KIW84_056568 [Pisum sativum]